MVDSAERLVTVVLTVSDLDRAMTLYGDGFGLNFQIDDHEGDDPWTSGRHAATSWTTGAFLHFALYQTKDGSTTSGAQVAFGVTDIAAAHRHRADPSGLIAERRSVDVPIIERGWIRHDIKFKQQ